MTSSTRDDGVMESLARRAPRQPEGGFQVEEGGDGAVAVMTPAGVVGFTPPVGMVLIDRREYDRLFERAMENVERESRLIAEAVRQAVEVERQECARLVEDMIIGREENGRTGQALAEAARKIRNRK